VLNQTEYEGKFASFLSLSLTKAITDNEIMITSHTRNENCHEKQSRLSFYDHDHAALLLPEAADRAATDG